jgi:RNA 2',3'-cyclic 3'-phosphodiesterase
MRLFAALDLDDSARLAVADVQAALRRTIEGDLRWVSPEQMHLTLVFVGEVPGSRVDGIVGSLAKPVSQVAFDITFTSLGAFPPRGAPRALWIGVGEGEAALLALEREVVNRLKNVGVDAGSGSFRPHLTLARFRRSRPADRRAILGQPPPERPIRQRIDHVTLYESVLSSGPPRYLQRSRANLTSI